MSNILITGGAGFIGYHLASSLLERGDNITIIDDFNNRYDPQLKEDRATSLANLETPPQIIRGDIRDEELTEKIFAENKFDTVVHLAAWASVQASIEQPLTYTSVNVSGTTNMLEKSRLHNVKNFIFASSSSVYGNRTDTPFRESDDVSRPISPYAATKVAGEALCATWHYLYKIPTTCLRFFTVYGTWGRPDMALFRFTDAILTNKPINMRGRNTKRDFTYVDDIVQGITSAIDKPQEYIILNLGNNNAIPLTKFISTIEKALGKKAKINEVPLPLGDVATTLADISLAQKTLNYNPSTSIEEGTEKFIQWYLDWYGKK
jgi:UDP-glucuronate 4-epimerase